MADRTFIEPVPILRGHLEEIVDVLQLAHGYHEANDLAHKYRNVGRVTHPSVLTTRLDKALSRAAGYLQEVNNGVSEE